jgi:uncharacterized membrane protein YczE
MKIAKKVFIYIIGLFFMATGVTLSIKSQLGISPVNSVPYVVSIITGFDLGRLVMIYFSLFVVGQLIILRKNFNPIYVIQVGFLIIFGYFVNITNYLLSFQTPDNYIFQLTILLLSIISLALGLVLYLRADIMPMPAEGFVIALQKIIDKEFYKIKYIMDTLLVVLSTVLSFAFLGELDGVREGTVLAALLIGRTMGIIEKVFTKQVKALINFMEK